MKKPSLSRSQVQEKIDSFFLQDTFSPAEIKKIIRLAMKYRIRLRSYRKKFCKKCFQPLHGVTRIKNGTKTVQCAKCNAISRWKVK